MKLLPYNLITKDVLTLYHQLEDGSVASRLVFIAPMASLFGRGFYAQIQYQSGEMVEVLGL